MAGGRGYAGKPRPALVLQADAFDRTESITLCLLTSTEVDAPGVRVMIDPTAGNGLDRVSFAMIDKVWTVERFQVGRFVGRLEPDDIARIDEALMVFLGLSD